MDQVACSVPTSAAAAAGNKNFSFSGAQSSSGNAQFSIGEGWVAVCSDDLTVFFHYYVRVDQTLTQLKIKRIELY